ncbi:hypothetical protein [Alicyclobacillus macrosporangiidus]|uniref:Uncharacterized protein n=1 Tax=Alicyclobacillus macrosporangiidus TaxID=392015 RepID=A0A1I7LHM8_9BACL|nr:hypothetical protein [Alicyclobacillus macrosporangiidus]SFV09168.1 hypothetical protein SAMN05421543_1522 [Alicyclobacillus macrosporangiidus]
MRRIVRRVAIRDPVWRGRMIRRWLRLRQAGSGMSAMMSNLIWLLATITLSTAGGLLLGNTLLNGVFPAALNAFTAMFGA